MLHIFCGDDTATSRTTYIAKRTAYVSQGHVLVPLDATHIDTLMSTLGTVTENLFGEIPVYETTGLIPACKKLYGRKTKQMLRDLHADPTTILVDWEAKSAYDMGIDKDKFPFVAEYKPAQSTFTLLSALRPGNVATCLVTLRMLSAHQPIEVTFSMIIRHFRLMIAILSGETPRDNPYLVRLAMSAREKYTTHTALKIYEKLLSIDINTKTGRKTPLDLQAQLEILIAMAL